MSLRTHRLTALVSLLVITPVGFASKFYSGPGAWWFNNYAGGVIYEIFWCLVVLLLRPRASIALIAIWVFAITCSLEFLQLWHPHFLTIVRATFIGRTLIGTSFSWWDFPHYFVGCCAGWFWMKSLGRKGNASHESDRHDC